MTSMLMEFETLDRDDIQEMLKGEWDVDKKRKRLKLNEDAHRKLPPPPPSPVSQGVTPPTNIQPQQI